MPTLSPYSQPALTVVTTGTTAVDSSTSVPYGARGAHVPFTSVAFTTVMFAVSNRKEYLAPDHMLPVVTDFRDKLTRKDSESGSCTQALWRGKVFKKHHKQKLRDAPPTQRGMATWRP